MKRRGKRNQGPVLGTGPVAARTPKVVPEKQSALQQSEPDDLLIIRFGAFDCGGPWCLSKAPEDTQRVLEAVRSFETMRTQEAFSGHPGKDYPVEHLIKPARDRLEDLRMDDQAVISRLRVGGAARLYGFLRGRYFFALWSDPKHEICPSTKKHT